MLKPIMIGAAVLVLTAATPLSAQDYYEMYPTQDTRTKDGPHNVRQLATMMLAVPGGELADPYRALADAFGKVEFAPSAVGAAKAATITGSSAPIVSGSPAPLAPGNAEIP